MFDYKVLDMVEVGVTNYRSCKEFKVAPIHWVEVMVESRKYSGITTVDGFLWSII
jgi:hypothetical protein